MITPIDLLYNDTIEHWDRAAKVLSTEELKEYRKCIRYEEDHWVQLLEAVPEGEREGLQQLQDSWFTRNHLECCVCFAQGLAMGLRLGLISAQA